MKIANLAGLFVLVTSAIGAPATLAFQPSVNRGVLSDLDPALVDSWQIEIEKQVEMYRSAYDLGDDAVDSLRQELESRIFQQSTYDEQMLARLGELSQKIEDAGISMEDESSPLVQEYSNEFIRLSRGMPLDPVQTSKWLESTLPPELVASGHSRFEELTAKARSSLATGKLDQERVAGRRASLSREAAEIAAHVDPNFNRPVPTSDIGERVEAMDRLARVARNIEPTRGRPTNTEALPNNGVPQIVPPPVTHQIPQQPVVPADAKPATPTHAGPPRPVVSKPGADVSRAAPQSAKPEPPPQPAPPLDDWEKYVLSTADKYGFNDAQLTNARSILSDLRRRAYQYQASRAEAFARAELMTDVKAREAEKTVLNRPLDALFAELKVRLDSLPTQSQRQKAGSTPAKR